MLTKSLCLAPLVLIAFGTGGDQGKKDLERMQGTWGMHALEINGMDIAKIQDTFLIVAKDEYKTKVKGKEIPGFRIKLDPSKNPAWIDMYQTQSDGSEKLFKGIYKLENDTLKMCRGAQAEQERPTQFATWPDTGYFVVTWKKQGK
jgi:uncharacterized protein (TIGR03067 family)